MSALHLLLDNYERKARLYPALVLLAPVACLFVGLSAGFFSGTEQIIGVIVGCGGAFLLAQLARDAGYRRQPLLYERWGGMPSVAVLRHRHTRLDAVTKARYHAKLARLVEGTVAPSPEQEREDAAAADVVYTAWSTFLRANTRDVRVFPLIFRENVSYGYRRNLWGLRPVGLVVASICCAGLGARIAWLAHTGGALPETLVASAVLALVVLLLWIFRFTSDWVRTPAEAYAERLAEAVETFQNPS